MIKLGEKNRKYIYQPKTNRNRIISTCNKQGCFVVCLMVVFVLLYFQVFARLSRFSLKSEISS